MKEIIIVGFQFKEQYNVYDLADIVKRLRAPDGCPWDKVQTHQTIRSDFIEEVYEAVEAIDENDTEHLREELGDVLLQVVFHCVIEEEQNSFTLDDAADDVCKKMILRHPHVFGDVKADTPDEVLKNWDEIKMQSKSQTGTGEAMESVSKALPSLMRSKKLWKKADRGGLRLDSAEQAIDLAQSRLDELKRLISESKTEEYDKKIGELLFSISGLSGFLKTDCEKSLYDACDNFIAQFKRLEALADEKGIDIQKSDSEAIKSLWNEISK